MARLSPVNSGYTIINGSGTGINGNRIDVWAEYKLGDQSIEGNYTPFTVYFYAALNSNYTSSTQNVSGLNSSLKIEGKNGTGVSNGAYNFTSPNIINRLGSYSENIYHNTDGTREITISGSFTTVSSYISGGAVSGKVTMPTIPRASTIGATRANIGETAVIAVNQSSQNFLHSISYKFGNLAGFVTAAGGTAEIETKFSNTNIPFAVPEEWYTQIPNDQSGVCTLTCKTYSGATQIGEEKLCEFVVTTEKSKCSPLVSGTVEDINADTLVLTGDKNIMVRLMSLALCVITAEAQNCAQINQKKIAGNVVTGNSCVIEKIETNSILFEATDSREYPGKFTAGLNMVPYVKLTVDASCKRTDPVSGRATLFLSGKCFKGSFGAVSNTLTLKYQVNSDEAVELSLYIRDDNSYEATVELDGLDYDSTHTIEVTVIDALDSETAQLTVQKGIPIFDFGENDIKFNVPVHIGAAELDYVVEQGINDIWMYRMWNSGIAECWGKKTIKTTVGSTWGNLYTSGYLTESAVDYPIEFVDKPMLNVSLTTDFSGALLMVPGGANAYCPSNKNTGAFEIARGTIATSSADYIFNYYAIGRWK